MARRRSGPSPGTVITLTANVPGKPTFSSNRQFYVTSSYNALQFTSYKNDVLLGGPVTITISDDIYTPAAYAADWQTAINANTTLTNAGELSVTVTYDTSQKKLIIETSGSTYTLALTGVGGVSTAAERCGFDSDKDAAVQLVSDNEAHGSGTITFDLDENGNGDKVQYAIYCNELSKYVGSGGIIDEASEVWQTAANWNNGGQSGRVTVVSLTDYTAYTFKAKAKDEGGSETAFSSDSNVMNTLPELDGGETSDNLDYEVSSGNTKITNTLSPSGNQATDEHEGYYGDINFDLILQSYLSLTNNGLDVQFSENYDSSDPDSADWNDCTEGSGSCGKTGLQATANGKSHTFVWDSYTDAGKSEYRVVYLRMRAKDSDSDPGAWVMTAEFWVNNRPGKIVWTVTNPYDKDTTPIIVAVMPYLRSGNKGYPSIEFRRKSNGEEELTLNSFESIEGWQYEYPNNTWNNLTVNGIPSSAIDGSNELRITVPTGLELSVREYLITGKMYEVRDRG